jgi:shikimate kinase
VSVVSNGAGAGDGWGVPDRHVVLIGLPGAGKSSVGRRLAKELERPFADADEQLELRTGRTIPRLFREEGEDAFRQMEAEMLADLLARDMPLVVAAGGGAEVSEDVRAHMAGAAAVVWLRGSRDFLLSRTDPSFRPLMVDDPSGALSRLDAERAARYAEVADHVVDIEPFQSGDDKPKRAIARHIVELLSGAGAVDEVDDNETADASLAST